jgi:phospholipid/cholesterol/gamma-HCH transport system permease protein
MKKLQLGRLAEIIGKKIRNYFQNWLNFSGFLKLTILEIYRFFFMRRQVSFMVLMRQILFTGFEALSLINLIGLAIGAIIIVKGVSLLENFGQSELGYILLIMIITTELGPLLTAFIIIARSGTSISTELGNMVVNHEVEALQAIGINPISYLVVPRVLGVVISLFCLSIYFNIAGLLGGYLVSSFVQSLSFVDFFSNLLQKITFRDILVSQLKSLVFGFIIAIISCYHGLSVKYATTEVPWRTIKAVVSSLTWIFISSILITLVFLPRDTQ